MTKGRFYCWLLGFLLIVVTAQGLIALDTAAVMATKTPSGALEWEGWFTIALFFIVFLSLVWELLPPDVIMVIGAGVLVGSGIITPQEFLIGFSRDIIFILGMLFVVAHAMETCGILSILARYALPKAREGWKAMGKITVPVSLLSGFLNNTPIVLMLTPIVRRWALDGGQKPSRYLIPLSFASILGGTCTLIGTSTNLIINDLLKNQSPDAQMSFFEIGCVGLPIAISGLLYLVTIGRQLVPERGDPAVSMTQETREFTGEFLVKEGSEVADISVTEAGRRYFAGQNLIEIERGSVVLDSPSSDEIIRAGDRLVFAGDIKQMAELHAVRGLQSLADKHFSLDFSSSHFSEVVVAATSSLVGKTLKRLDFRNTYGASVIAVYRQGTRLTSAVGDTVLHAGDTLMLLSSEPWHGGDTYMTDFYYIRHNEKIPLYKPWRVAFVMAVVSLMVCSVLVGIPMVIASFGAALSLLLSGMISVTEARQSIRWSLLVLIGSSFAFGVGLVTTGVADYIAERILHVVGTQPNLLLAAVFALTMMATEVITNNAAALLLFPIAAQVAFLGGFDSISAVKAIGITVAVASSCSFATPIGYQTNTIVYGPGGYRFTDYGRVGLPLSFIVMFLSVFLIPRIWPLS